MVLEPEVVEERRVRLLEARPREVPEERASRPPDRSSPGARASRPRPRSGARRRSGAARRERGDASGRAARAGRSPGSRRPPRRRVATSTRKASGNASSANQPSAFRTWRLFTCPSSWATTTSTWPSEKRPSRSVSQSTTCVDGPKPAENAFAWSVTSCIGQHAHGRAHALDLLDPLDAGAQRRVADRMRAGGAEPAVDEREEGRDRDEDGRAGDPPVAPSRPASPTAIAIAAITETAVGGERRPLAREPGADVERAEAPVVLPPELGDAERQRDEPERRRARPSRRRSRCSRGRGRARARRAASGGRARRARRAARASRAATARARRAQ